MRLRLLPAIAGLAVGLILPATAQEQNTVDPEVRQQIEALVVNLDEAYNKSDAPAVAALFAPDAVEVWYGQPEGGLASGQQAIEKRYAGELGPSPHHLSHKLLQAYPIGSDICAIMEWSLPPMDTIGHHCVAIFGRDADTWKIRVSYAN
jgi:ketosteroid isomerase-like protein